MKNANTNKIFGGSIKIIEQVLSYNPSIHNDKNNIVSRFYYPHPLPFALRKLVKLLTQSTAHRSIHRTSNKQVFEIITFV